MEGHKESERVEKNLAYWSQSRQLQLQIFSGVLVLIVGLWAGIKAEQGVIAPTYIAAFTLVTLPILEGLLPLSHAIERIPAYHESLQRIDSIQQFVPEEQEVKNKYKRVEKRILPLNNYFIGIMGKKWMQSTIFLCTFLMVKNRFAWKKWCGKINIASTTARSDCPTSGKIAINNQPPIYYGEHISDMMGVLNQKPYLFATTVENNIRLGNQEATKEEIECVMKQVKLDTYIHSLPNGLQTQMEETGQRFSGGERQRIALARILLKNTPIVILDEPTVALDPETEYELIETIFTALKDKTIIWITHHLIGIERADEILFLDEGRIAIQGTHEQLIQTNERYQTLYKLDRGQ
ncbi:amino acid ABC transporter ATP-binding/permease protein [Bacillus sp. N9]